MEQLEPTYIITGHCSHEKLIEAIIAYCKSGRQLLHAKFTMADQFVVKGEEHQDCQYQVRPSKEYKLNAALARLSNLHITRLGVGQRVGFERDVSTETEGHASRVGSGGHLTSTQRMQSADDQDADGDQSMRLALLRLGCFTSVEAQLSVSRSSSIPQHSSGDQVN